MNACKQQYRPPYCIRSDRVAPHCFNMAATLEQPPQQLQDDQQVSKETPEIDSSSSKPEPARGTADAPAAPNTSQQPLKARKLLVILHGQRIDDAQVRTAIQVGVCTGADVYLQLPDGCVYM